MLTIKLELNAPKVVGKKLTKLDKSEWIQFRQCREWIRPYLDNMAKQAADQTDEFIVELIFGSYRNVINPPERHDLEWWKSHLYYSWSGLVKRAFIKGTI